MLLDSDVVSKGDTKNCCDDTEDDGSRSWHSKSMGKGFLSPCGTIFGLTPHKNVFIGWEEEDEEERPTAEVAPVENPSETAFTWRRVRRTKGVVWEGSMLMTCAQGQSSPIRHSLWHMYPGHSGSSLMGRLALRVMY